MRRKDSTYSLLIWWRRTLMPTFLLMEKPNLFISSPFLQKSRRYSGPVSSAPLFINPHKITIFTYSVYFFVSLPFRLGRYSLSLLRRRRLIALRPPLVLILCIKPLYLFLLRLVGLVSSLHVDALLCCFLAFYYLLFHEKNYTTRTN